MQQLFHIGAQADEPIEDLILKAAERWEILHLFANDSPSYHNDTAIMDRWRHLLGERFVVMEDSSLVCEVTAGLIHSLESARDVDTVIADLGVSGADAAAVRNAIVPITRSRVARVASGKLPAGVRRPDRGICGELHGSCRPNHDHQQRLLAAGVGPRRDHRVRGRAGRPAG